MGVGSVGGSSGVAGARRGHVVRASGAPGVDLDDLAASRTEESKMPSGHAVAGGQHKLSARQPAPLQALLPSFGWPLRDVEPPPMRGPVVFRRPPLASVRPPPAALLLVPRAAWRAASTGPRKGRSLRAAALSANLRGQRHG